MRTAWFSLLLLAALVPSSSDGGNLFDFESPAGATLFGAGVGESISSSIFEVDPETGATSNEVTALPSSQIFSLATQPGTNRIFCVYQDRGIQLIPGPGDTLPLLPIDGPGIFLGPPLSLGWIDPVTGEITRVADFSFESAPVFSGIPGITFDCEGNLYAVSGGSFPGESLEEIQEGPRLGPSQADGLVFSVNLLTGELTLIVEGATGDSHCLEFNPEDGLLYHFYTGEGRALETVHPVSGDLSDVPLGGSRYQAIQAVVYAGNGIFLGHQSGVDSFYAIRSDGQVEYVGPTPEDFEEIRGLTYSRAIGCPGASFQPDLLIGRRITDLRLDDFYTRTGKEQTVSGVRITARKGKSVVVPLEIQNDGSEFDRIRLGWGIVNLDSRGRRVGTGPRFRRQLFLRTPSGPRNVTAQISSRGTAMAPGESLLGFFKLTVRRQPARKVTDVLTTVSAVSLGDGSKVDVARARIRARIGGFHRN